LNRTCFGFSVELGEDARSGTRHARLRGPLPEPRKLRCHLGVSGGHDGFKIVLSAPREKGRYFESFGLACQRESEDFLRGNRNLRRDHEIPGGWQIERAQVIAEAFAERAAAEEKEGHVGAQFRAERQQLGALVQNLETLLHNLAGQETQLQQALTQTNAALARTASALNGTGGSLADIALELPVTVHLADLIMADLAPDSDMLLPHLGQLDTAIAQGPSVFGGVDANGFATRISPIVGCSSLSVCPNLPSSAAVDFLLGRAP